MKNTLSAYFEREIKKIGFFGLGKSNTALLNILPLGNTPVVFRSDKQINRELIPTNINIAGIHERECAFDDLTEDVLVLSPSIRRDRDKLISAKEKGILLTSDAELFFRNVDSKALIFAISGSDGKSTTATLAARLLRNHFGRLSLCGNIGVPMLAEAEAADAFVAELSSFQLTYASPKVYRALITNITPNHLNWHSSFEEYRDVKLSLLDNANERIICADDPELCRYGKKKALFAVYSSNLDFQELKSNFTSEIFITKNNGFILKNGSPLIDTKSIGRREKHNIQNLMGAIALSDGYVDISQIKATANSFGGLAHRAEFIRKIDGIDYINSSIDTSPARTAATLRSIRRPCILILGGIGKGLSYNDLSRDIKSGVRAVIVMGKNRNEIISKISGVASVLEAKDLEEAVFLARSMAKFGDTILLSPSATSYDSYSSFEERGNHFKQIVNNLRSKNTID